MDTVAGAIDLFRRGKAHEAERTCKQRLAACGDDADTLSLLAEIQVSTGRTESAAALLKRLVRLRPGDAAAQRRLAEALLALGLPTEAETALRAAITLDPLSA